MSLKGLRSVFRISCFIIHPGYSHNMRAGFEFLFEIFLSFRFRWWKNTTPTELWFPRRNIQTGAVGYCTTDDTPPHTVEIGVKDECLENMPLWSDCTFS